MSHSVTVSIAMDVNKEKVVLNSIKDELKNMNKVYAEHFSQELKQLNTAIIYANSELDKLAKITLTGEMERVNEKVFEYQKIISTITKKVSNIKSLINPSSYYKSIKENKRDTVNKLIEEYGIIALTAIKEMQNNSQDLKSEEIKSLIAKIRHEKADAKKLEEIQDQVEDELLLNNMDSNLKSQLVKLLDFNNISYQEAMDLKALIGTKINEHLRMLSTAQDLEASLKDIEFKVKERNFSLEPDGRIKMEIVAFKDSSKDFVLNLYSDRRLSWQFGNYENHMCDADGKKFRGIALPKNGIVVSDYVITRNTSNSAPLYKQRKLKERAK